MGYVFSKLSEIGYTYGSPFRKEKKKKAASYRNGLKLSKLQRIDENLTFLSNDLPKYQTTKRPLVVIVAWLTAQEKHLDKYRNLYLARGFDCVTLRSKISQVLAPIGGSQIVARNLLDFLLTTDYDDIVVHTFSVGAYQFAEAMVIMNNNKIRYGHLGDKIKGMVMDSVIDYYHTPNGLPRVMSTNPVVIKLLQWTAKLYMFICYKTVTWEYIKASKLIRSNSYPWPRLIFVSEDDVLDNYEGNKLAAEEWRSLGVDVQWKCWEHSAHVQHYCNYPEEYVDELDKFLVKIHVGHVTSRGVQSSA